MARARLLGFSHSDHTFRIKHVDSAHQVDDLRKCIQSLSNTLSHKRSLRAALKDTPEFDFNFSLAAERQGQTATVSTASSSNKKKLWKMMKQKGGRAHGLYDLESQPVIDDHFRGLTVLACPENADVESVFCTLSKCQTNVSISICLVHGINGSGIDTFSHREDKEVHQAYKHWARDFLKDDFQTARVMVYDYCAQMFERQYRADPEVWPDDLLQELDAVRAGIDRRVSSQPVILMRENTELVQHSGR